MDRITAAKVFIDVAERQSQTATAEHLNISRAMVSRYIKELENWVGTRLMHRTTRRLSLTDAGQAFLIQCKQLVDLSDDIEKQAQHRSNKPSGTLRIACSFSLAQSLLSYASAEFTQQYPDVKINLVVNNKNVNLIEEGIDLAIRISNDLDPNQIAIPLGSCHSVLCAAPAYLSLHDPITHPNQLQQHNCLSYDYFGTTHWKLSKGDQYYRIPISGSISSNEANVLLFSSLHGSGISQQPLYSAQPFIHNGSLVAILSDWDLPVLGIHAIYASRQQMTPALRVFIDFIKQRFQGITL